MASIDDNITISELKEKVRDFNHARNWEQFHTPKEVAISISIEASELLEIFQWKALSRSDIQYDPERIKQIEEEIADITIYLLSLINTLKIDLGRSVLEKLDKNALKYPIKG